MAGQDHSPTGHNQTKHENLPEGGLTQLGSNEVKKQTSPGSYFYTHSQRNKFGDSSHFKTLIIYIKKQIVTICKIDGLLLFNTGKTR